MADSDEKRKKAAQDAAPNWRKSKSEGEATNKKQEREERLGEARQKAVRERAANVQKEAPQKAAAAEAPEAEKEAAAPEPQYMAEHTVAGGETLSHIALKYYNSAVRDKWMAIYEANKEVIGDNPSLVRPGQVLKIPKL